MLIKTSINGSLLLSVTVHVQYIKILFIKTGLISTIKLLRGTMLVLVRCTIFWATTKTDQFIIIPIIFEGLSSEKRANAFSLPLSKKLSAWIWRYSGKKFLLKIQMFGSAGFSWYLIGTGLQEVPFDGLSLLPVVLKWAQSYLECISMSDDLISSLKHISKCQLLKDCASGHLQKSE